MQATELEKTDNYYKTQMQKDRIVDKLKENGCRITKQRMILLDVILSGNCTSCKEIYYKALAKDNSLGIATVYRMVNLLEEIGVISRKNMYNVNFADSGKNSSVCTVSLDDGTVYQLSAQTWNSIISAGLRSQGYLRDQKLVSITMK